MKIESLYRLWLEANRAIRAIEAEGQGEIGSEFCEIQEERLSAALDRRRDLEERIVAMPADTAVGIFAKLAIAEFTILETSVNGEMEIENRLAISASRDARRISGATIDVPQPHGPHGPKVLNSEQALLGAIFVNNDAYHRVADFLKPEDFAEPVHGRIYKAAGKLIETGHRADPVTLRLMFDQDPALEEFGGALYIDRLWAHAPWDADLAKLAGEIKARESAAA